MNRLGLGLKSCRLSEAAEAIVNLLLQNPDKEFAVVLKTNGFPTSDPAFRGVIRATEIPSQKKEPSDTRVSKSRIQQLDEMKWGRGGSFV